MLASLATAPATAEHRRAAERVTEAATEAMTSLTDIRREIYEPPRFFEAFLQGRAYTEPVDITARICGICPVAHQMSACHALERLCGVRVDGALRELRRLPYCGEWISSHTLHIGLLHAPDLLGYDSRLALPAGRPGGVPHRSAGSVRQQQRPPPIGDEGPGGRRRPGVGGRHPVPEHRGPRPPLSSPPLSSHGVGLADAIALGEAIGRAPRTLVVLAIEAASFDHGASLSDAVRAAGIDVVERLPELVPRGRPDETEPADVNSRWGRAGR